MVEPRDLDRVPPESFADAKALKLKDTIARWVQEQYPDHAKAHGRCREAAHKLVAAFPEAGLRITKGHVYCPEPWGKRGHWWCVDEEGEIVDPTAHQFTSGIFRYEEYQEGDPIRHGPCMYCGVCIWGPPEEARPLFCGDRCREKMTAEFNA